MANANQKASCGQELFGALFEKQKIRRKIVGNRANQESKFDFLATPTLGY